MLVNDKDAAARLGSPLNLINRLKNASNDRKNAMSLFIPPKRTVDIKIEDKLSRQIEQVKVIFNPFDHPPASVSQNPPTPTVITVETPKDPTLSDIIENHDTQIGLGLAHDNALKLLNNSISALSTKLEDVKADKLPSVVAAASKVVESIRKERVEAAKNNKDREVHYHFYTPVQKKVTEYEVIDVA